MITQITDHIQRALDRLREQYKENPGVNSLIEIFATKVQEEEDLFQSYEEGRALATAVGVQLDLMGTIVGLARVPGQSDDVYRQLLYAKIGENVSDGEPESVLAFWKVLTGASMALIRDGSFGEIGLSANLDFTQDQVNKFMKDLRSVVAAGVRVDGIESFDPVEPFSFNGALPGNGFGSVYDGLVGGKFATVLRQNDRKFAFTGIDPNTSGYGSVYDPIVGGVLVGL